MPTQQEKAELFRTLHHGEGAFIIPNPWDIGTARLLERLGFQALATTSAGYAFSNGKPDFHLPRELTMDHIRAIVSATNLPVSGDLQNGFGDPPETVAETIRLAADAGLAGASIEDATGRDSEPLYEIGHAAERIRAAAEAAHSLPFKFTLTARAETYLNGRPDLKETVERLQQYQEAGADVLYAPGLTKPEEIRTLVSSVDRPLNVLMALRGVDLDQHSLSALGVKRISLGSALSRAALGVFLRASREMLVHGTFAFASEAVSYTEINSLFNEP